MTPALEAALAKIEWWRGEKIKLAQPDPRYPGSSWELDAARLPQDLAQLDRQAALYRFIADMDAVTDSAERRRLLDELYVYSRQGVYFRPEPGLILNSGDELPTDAFDIARFIWFSVPQWWQGVTGEPPTLCDLTPKYEPYLSPFHFEIAPGSTVYRLESVFEATRWQSFDLHAPFAHWRLAVVIRQWVEEPDDMLATALDENVRWQSLISQPKRFWGHRRFLVAADW